jgi:hypothetical protein
MPTPEGIMRKSILLLAATAVAAIASSWSIGPGGLSGWQGLPCSDVLETGLLRAGGSMEYTDTDNGTILSVPLKVCWGMKKDVELGAVIPVFPVDNAFDGSFMGDITFSGGWLYEVTRGGSALKLTGRLTLPSGEETRDTGAELAVGGITSTTFLDFRLSISAEYALNGGKNPFDDTISDVMYFTIGGTSFVSQDVLLSARMNGSTSSVFRAGAGAQLLLDDNLALDGGLSMGLNNFENFGLYAGIAWTGSGF